MKIFLFSLAVCLAWLGAGLLIGDYVELRERVAYIKAEQLADRALKQRHHGNDARDRLNATVGDAIHVGEDKPKWTDVALAALTFALALGTMCLYLDAREKGRKELRAYLGIGSGEVFLLPNNIIRAVVGIQNFGKTPAHRVRPGIAGELRKPGDRRPFNDPNLMSHVQPIAPTMGWTFGHEFIDMTAQDLVDVLEDKKLVYIWGYVTYDDIYGDQHTLRFRFRNVVKVIVPTDRGPAIQKWKYYPEEEGNAAD